MSAARSWPHCVQLLRGCGAHIFTHNIGHVHSVAVPVFCAGVELRCVPTGRLLIHDIAWGLNQGFFNETMLREAMEGLRDDRTSIAQVIAETINRPVKRNESRR